MDARNGYKAQGFTIVELMVAMAIGLLISAVVGATYVQGVRSHAQDERFSAMLQNGRFALDQMQHDLMMVDYYGEVLDSAVITSSVSTSNDCSIALYDASTSLLVNNPNSSPALSSFDITAGSCAGLLGTVAPNTPQVAIKRTAGVGITTGQADGIVYLRSNSTSGVFRADTGTVSPGAGESDWLYQPVLYYIRNEGAGPSLCRLTLSGTGFAAQPLDECVAEGVELFHLQFGIDTDADSIANRYSSAPTPAELDAAVTVRIYLLVRTATADPAYTNSKTYALGDLSVSAANDGFYRRVMSTTVTLRNTANLQLLD